MRAEPFACFAGVEVANASRTLAYLKRGLAGPKWTVFDAPGCFCAALETEVYDTPESDPAPWFEPSRPESADFLGMYAEVAVDTVLRRGLTQTANGGGVVGRLVLRPRTLGVGGLMFARNQRGMHYGERWLSEVLSGGLCTDCGSDELEILTHCTGSLSALKLAGTDDRAETPDSVDFNVTDLSIRVAMAADDWTPVGTGTIAAKWFATGDQRQFLFRLQTNGTLILFTSSTGADAPSGTSTVATGAADGSILLVRVDLDINDGGGNRVYRFFTKTLLSGPIEPQLRSDNGWTQLGATVTTAGTTSIFDSTAAAEVGARTDLTEELIGRVYAAVVYDGLDPATRRLVADPDFSTAPAGQTTVRDDTGKIWTMLSGAAIVSDAAVPDESGFRSLLGVGIADGPIFTEIDAGHDCTVQRFAFQLVAGTPELYGRAAVLLKGVSLAAGATLNELVSAPEWTGGRALRLELKAPSTDATSLRITARVSLAGNCPDSRVPVCLDINIPLLPADSTLIIDGRTRRVTLRDPITLQERSGLHLLTFEKAFVWPDVPPCTDLCVQIVNSGAQAVTVSLDGYVKEL